MNKLLASPYSLLLILFVSAHSVVASAQELREKLRAIEGISAIESLQSTIYPEKYVLKVTQLLHPKDSSAGTFTQRVIVHHVGFDRPTALVTEGYGAAYALREGYQEELSRLFNTNVVVVEHRYFLESAPDSLNWDYLTAENSAYDLHRIVTLLKDLYPAKWISTGISKGGQTALFYRAYFPDDVAFSVPYVAPCNKALEDGRHEIFLKRVGSKKERAQVEKFQKAILKKRKKIVPLLDDYCEAKKLEFRISADELLDYSVLEYPFAFWQWGTAAASIPPSSSSDDVLFSHLMAICDPSYFAENSSFIPFCVQAARELGYYGYDTAPLKKLLTIASSEGYFNRIMLPQGLNIPFDPSLYTKTYAFLKENDPKMIFIYGETDPWTASRIPSFERKKNLQIYSCPGGSHTTRIDTMPEDMKADIKEQINKWLQE